MVSVFDVASYIYTRYKSEKGQKIDEMKLHKLLYFTQREAIIQTGNPLFDASFYGWRFGPILKEIRDAYANNLLDNEVSASALSEIEPIVNHVFELYADKDSWSLSRLTHGEISWKNSRIGIPENMNSDRCISIDDIRLDAERIKQRREYFDHINLN